MKNMDSPPHIHRGRHYKNNLVSTKENGILMLKVLLLTILFNLATAISITFTGNRSLISGNIFENFWGLIFNWKFIVAMGLAVVSRFLFILINNQLLNIPSLARSSTTITVFITATSYIFIIAANILFLHEQIKAIQFLAIGLILAGVIILSL